MDSNDFLTPKSQSIQANDDSGKRSDDKAGMWFGPRLGRSFQRHPKWDGSRWIAFDGMIRHFF